MEKYKMEIEMDEKKLYDEGYDVAEINSKIDSVFSSMGIRKTGKGRYEGKGTHEDFSNFGGATIILKKQPWFMHFVSKWILHSDEGTEDFAEYYRNET
jgi:hypothetical protein